MTCILPPELDEVELIAYLEGDAEQQVVEHLEQCTHCLARAAQLDSQQQRLRYLLYRVDCPSPTELAEFTLDLIQEGNRSAITEHLQGCPHCTQELEQLQAYLQANRRDFGGEQTKSVRVLLADLISRRKADQSQAIPVTPALRGQESTTRIYRTEAHQLALRFEPDPDTAEAVQLVGYVPALEPGQWSASVFLGDELISSRPVDENGNFTVGGLQVGVSYELVLSGEDVVIVVGRLSA